MSTDRRDEAALRARLTEVEEDLAVLRAEMGPPTGEPQDFGDAGADLATREELAAQVEGMEEQRRRLLDRLGESAESENG